MVYHQDPIDRFGFNKKSRVIYFPADASMGHVRAPDASAPFPHWFGAGAADDYPNLLELPQPWRTYRWTRFPVTPNLVFPSNPWNRVANVKGASPASAWGAGDGQTFDVDETVTSWVMELWAWPDFSRTDRILSIWHVGPYWSNWSVSKMDHYPYNATADFLEVYLRNFYGHRYLGWIQHHGAPGNLVTGGDSANYYRSRGDYSFSYVFDCSSLMVDNTWNHIVLEWHYGGTEKPFNTCADWADYWDNYDPTCRVFINSREVPRGFKGWTEEHPEDGNWINGPTDDEYTLQNATNYHSGDVYHIDWADNVGDPYEASNRYPYGLLVSQAAYLGGNALSADYPKAQGWWPSGALWKGGITVDAGTGETTSLGTYSNYNFAGYMTEFRLWLNKRYSSGGYGYQDPYLSHVTACSSGLWNIGYDNQRVEGREDGLVAYYPLNEGHGDNLYDKSRYNNPAALMRYTPKTTDPYPYDENELAAYNVNWNAPPDGLFLKEANSSASSSVFIRQNNIHAFIEEDSDAYASDTIKFGEIYDTTPEFGITNFSFANALSNVTPLQVGDDVLVNWTIDPSCLKRDMLQTMTNMVTVAIPHYTEDLETYMELQVGSGFAPITEPDDTGSIPPNEYFMSELEILPVEPGVDADSTSVSFIWDDTNGANYSVFRGYNPYWFDEENKERFENVLDSTAIDSTTLRISGINVNDYYFLLSLRAITSLGFVSHEFFYSENAVPNIIAMHLENPSYDANHQITSVTSIEHVTDRVLIPTFSGVGSVGDPHILNLAVNSKFSEFMDNLQMAKLWIIRKYASFDVNRRSSSFTRRITIPGQSVLTRPTIRGRQ